MFSKILVPTDFSSGADAALACARAMAAQFGGSLELLHVLKDPTALMSAETFIPDLPNVKQAMVDEAMHALDNRLTSNDRHALHATATTVFGPEAARIVQHAREQHVNLIVMGTHGRTGMSHLLLGSVAERVARTAPCAVLTVREGAQTGAQEGTVTVPA